MRKIITAIIGVTFIFMWLVSLSSCTNATAQSAYTIQKVKPAVPSAIDVTSHYSSNAAISRIKEMHGKGYVTKAVTNGGEGAYIIVVMEKYN